MNSKITYIIFLFLQISYIALAETKINDKGQAVPPPTVTFGDEAFEPTENTVIRWLGNAGFLVNSHGTCIMIDPILEGFDMPLLINVPIKTDKVPYLNAVLVTHSDNDHFSAQTCQKLKKVVNEYHSTKYVETLMEKIGLNAKGHNIGEEFKIGCINIKTTPAYHTWQNELKDAKRIFKKEDACGFILETPDGVIWAPGDSRLMKEHLKLSPVPDIIFFDFSDSIWHFGLEGAKKIANTYPNAILILSHWGTVDAPNMKEFNGNPEDLKTSILNPERIKILAPGEPFILKKKQAKQ